MYIFVGITIAVIFLAALIVIAVLFTSQNNVSQSTAPSFEKELLEKLRNDPQLLIDLETNTKATLEKELSEYLGYPFVFRPEVNVELIHEDPNTLHLILPSDLSSDMSALPSGNSALDDVLNALKPKIVYGTLMGSLKSVFWRVGVDKGSCYSDILAELDRIKAGTQLQNCT